jgi:hypothetical protein
MPRSDGHRPDRTEFIVRFLTAHSGGNAAMRYTLPSRMLRLT